MHAGMGPYPQNNSMGNYGPQGSQYGPQGKGSPTAQAMSIPPNDSQIVFLFFFFFLSPIILKKNLMNEFTVLRPSQF